MSGITIDVKIEDKEVKALFQRLLEKMQDLTPAMKVIGQIIRTSVVKNFEAGGRPHRWKPSKRAMVEGGRTMVDTGRLMKYITSRAYRDRAEVGTNVIYAAIHQFGGDIEASRSKYLKFRIGGRWAQKKKVRIPARPFLVVQDEDWQEIKEAILEYLMEER